MDHILDRSDDGDSIFSKKPQTDFLRETETTKWVRGRLVAVGEEGKLTSPIYLDIVRKYLRTSL